MDKSSYGFAVCFFCEAIMAVSKLQKVRVPPRFGGGQKQSATLQPTISWLSKPRPGVEANACKPCAERAEKARASR